MADIKESPRVIIVGGSIAGLALANMLEQTGVDYIVLEKYQIAPQLGASIALLPNGLRILDQIGCLEALQKEVGGSDAFCQMQTRGPDGKLFMEGSQFGQAVEKRLGYLPIALERRMLIQVLYDNLKLKEKVLTNKGVVQIKQIPSRVEVITKEGEVFEGDILVGADGFHSTVRKVMWHQGKQDHPASFAIESQSASIEYSCIFGMSEMKEGFPRNTSVNGQGYGYAHLVMDGPDDTVFWFLFAQDTEKRRGLWESIPRYTDAEKDALAAKHADDKVTDTLTFGDLYRTQKMSTLQAVPEAVFEQWHNGRIITIGDAAHKFNPIGGQGGSNAIEDAAVLTTHLVNAVKACDDRRLTSEDIDAVFKKTQAERMARVQHFKNYSHTIQAINGRATALWTFIGSRIIPALGMDLAADMLCEGLRPAARVGPLRIKTPKTADPWTDELPSKPWTSLVPLNILSILISVGLTIVAFEKIAGSAAPSQDMFDPTLQFLGSPLKLIYTGVAAIDEVLRVIVIAFSDAVSWQDEGHSLQFLYLLIYLVPILVVWYVESSRKHSSWTLIAGPSVYALLMNLAGIGVIGPVYLIANALRDNTAICLSADKRAVPLAKAKWILPSILVGYGLPTLLIFSTSLDPENHQLLLAAWQFAAIPVSMLLFSMSRVSEIAIASTKSEKVQPFQPRDQEAVFLNRTYKIVFGLCFIVHLATAYWISSSSSDIVSFSRLLIPTYEIAEPRADTIAAFMFTILRWDHLFAIIAFWVYGSFSVLTMRGSGIITSMSAIKAFGAFTLAQLATGPGAALMGLWLWREKTMRLPVPGRR